MLIPETLLVRTEIMSKYTGCSHDKHNTVHQEAWFWAVLPRDTARAHLICGETKGSDDGVLWDRKRSAGSTNEQQLTATKGVPYDRFTQTIAGC